MCLYVVPIGTAAQRASRLPERENMKKQIQDKIESAIKAYSEASSGLDTFIGKRSKDDVSASLKEYKADVLKPLAKSLEKTLSELPEYVDFRRFESAVLMRFIRAEKKAVAKKTVSAAKAPKVTLETTETPSDELTEDEALNKFRFAVSVLVTRFDWKADMLSAQVEKTVKQLAETR